jgi:hypothetical protein
VEFLFLVFEETQLPIKHGTAPPLSGWRVISDDLGGGVRKVVPADGGVSLVLAESFSKHKEGLCLNGLTSLSDAAAESLSKHAGDLNLYGLTSLSDAAAESLSKHEGFLGLDGLTSLSDAAAESLGKHAGDLGLNGLTSLSDAAAESLGKHKGKLSFNLDNLPPSAAEILRQHPSFQEDDDDGEDWDDDE